AARTRPDATAGDACIEPAAGARDAGVAGGAVRVRVARGQLGAERVLPAEAVTVDVGAAVRRAERPTAGSTLRQDPPTRPVTGRLTRRTGARQRFGAQAGHDGGQRGDCGTQPQSLQEPATGDPRDFLLHTCPLPAGWLVPTQAGLYL